jgi:hypothetical protein
MNKQLALKSHAQLYQTIRPFLFSPEQTEAAVKQAIQLGAIGFDAVKHLLLCSIERKPPRLNLDIYPYLPRIQVKTTATNSYLSLLNKVAV